MMRGLREATRDLHHAAERHQVGAAMAAGTISDILWGRWLASLSAIHAALDPHMPPVLRRTAELDQDLADRRLRFDATAAPAALTYAAMLDNPQALLAAGYVFTGAYLMGGAITDRALAGRLPCAHLRWTDRRQALDAWRPWREATGCEDEARHAFSIVLEIMEAIAGD